MDMLKDHVERGGIDLLTTVKRLWRERFRVVGLSLAAGLLALGIASLLPKVYTADAVILPPEEVDLMSNLSLSPSALAKFPAFGLLGETFTPSDLAKAVLLSRTVQDEVIDRFDLMKIYKVDKRFKARKMLQQSYSVKLSPQGTIVVSASDKKPERAAQMASAFLDLLDHYYIESRNTRARRTRQFLERRVIETDSLLRVSEDLLRAYQEEQHAVVPPTVSGGGVQATAELMARKITLEVRLGVLRTYLRNDNDEVVQTRTELEALKSRIGSLPALQGELARLIRDAKVNEQLFLLLTAELEQARIRETMDTPTVQVVDPAIPPERHSFPKKGVTAIAATFLAFMACAIYLTIKPEIRFPAKLAR